jgi:cyclopropane fatty-acyl-phospholipid synthase-like methyltransferase
MLDQWLVAYEERLSMNEIYKTALEASFRVQEAMTQGENFLELLADWGDALNEARSQMKLDYHTEEENDPNGS